MQTAYDQLIYDVAQAADLNPALMQAIVCQESGGDAGAHRVEPHYLTNPVVVREARAHSRRWQGTPNVLTETTDRASSWGLGQMIGQSLREAGCQERYLTVLVDPQLNVQWMVTLLQARQARWREEARIIASWNGGMGVRWPLPARSVIRGYVAKVEAYMRETPYG